MKKAYGALALIFLTISLCVFAIFYVGNITQNALTKVTDIQNNIKKENYINAKNLANDLSLYWENNSNLLTCLLHHKDIEEIEESIAVLKNSLNEKDSFFKFWTESTRTLVKLKHLNDSEALNFGNLF
ncbi:hypothetical protein FACS189465_1720 [Clostridia bacterium]|nr:hypothetical protein FACS189465_1720 [Clostridia bacterium]